VVGTDLESDLKVTSLATAMVLFMKILSVSVVLSAQVFAAPGTEGSCADEDNILSLLQVKEIIEMGKHRPGRLPLAAMGDPLASVAAPLDEALGKIDDVIHGINIENDADRAILKTQLMDHVAHELSWRVLPSSLGNVQMEDNLSFVDLKAQAAAMPGTHGGPVIHAYKKAFAHQAHGILNGMQNHLAETLARGDEYRAADNRFTHNIRDQVESTEDAFRKDQQRVLDTAIQERNVEQTAIHEVQKAKKSWEEMAIKKAQTDRAAIAGRIGGQALGYRNAAEMLRHEMNTRAVKAQKHEEKTLADAQMKFRKDGLDVADRYEADREVALENYQAQLDNKMHAMRARAARDTGVLEESMTGAEDINDALIRQAANHEVDSYGRQTVHDAREVSRAVEQGPGAVLRDQIADAVTRPGLIEGSIENPGMFQDASANTAMADGGLTR